MCMNRHQFSCNNEKIANAVRPEATRKKKKKAELKLGESFARRKLIQCNWHSPAQRAHTRNHKEKKTSRRPVVDDAVALCKPANRSTKRFWHIFASMIPFRLACVCVCMRLLPSKVVKEWRHTSVLISFFDSHRRQFINWMNFRYVSACERVWVRAPHSQTAQRIWSSSFVAKRVADTKKLCELMPRQKTDPRPQKNDELYFTETESWWTQSVAYHFARTTSFALCDWHFVHVQCSHTTSLSLANIYSILMLLLQNDIDV